MTYRSCLPVIRPQVAADEAEFTVGHGGPEDGPSGSLQVGHVHKRLDDFHCQKQVKAGLQGTDQCVGAPCGSRQLEGSADQTICPLFYCHPAAVSPALSEESLDESEESYFY